MNVAAIQDKSADGAFSGSPPVQQHLQHSSTGHLPLAVRQAPDQDERGTHAASP